MRGSTARKVRCGGCGGCGLGEGWDAWRGRREGVVIIR